MANNNLPLPPALSGELSSFKSRAGRISYYHSSLDNPPAATTPLLLVHSVNAAGSAYEMRPLFEHYKDSRAVYAPDLAGFGKSERKDQRYTPRLMTDVVHAMLEEIRRIHGQVPIDVVAASLSSEFIARAAVESPGLFRSITLVSPTGFDKKTPANGKAGTTRGHGALRAFLKLPLWRREVFELLTRPSSVRYFLERTWGAKQIDEGLFNYNCLTTRQPGAEHAPLDFVAGFLFSADIKQVYRSLTVPVWVAHGVRGDFVDFTYKASLAHKPNWAFQVFPTGALPYFEVLDRFITHYEAFLDELAIEERPLSKDRPAYLGADDGIQAFEKSAAKVRVSAYS